MTSEIKTFRSLHVWQTSYELGLLTYGVTSGFPEVEKYALSSQMRRAAISVSSNIAEGYGRLSSKDKEHFYVMASGSCSELESQIEIAKGLNYLNDAAYQDLINKVVVCQKQLRALLKTHRS